MTLRYLKIFIAVYEYNSITKAATHLHLAQPSVSLAVKEIEEYFGTRLFERIGHRISPTEAGKEVYRYALHICEALREMDDHVKNYYNHGILRIGASITIGTHILPPLVKQYQSLYPKLKLQVIVNQSAIIENALLENQLDLALIETQPANPDVMAISFFADALCAIIPVSHPLSSAKKSSLRELSQYPFLMREKGSAGREIIDASLALQNITVNPVWESSSTQAIVRAVSCGLGVAILPALLVERDIREKKVLLLPLEEKLTRNMNIIYHKSKYLTESMISFIELCEDFGNNFKAE